MTKKFLAQAALRAEVVSIESPTFLRDGASERWNSRKKGYQPPAWGDCMACYPNLQTMNRFRLRLFN